MLTRLASEFNMPPIAPPYALPKPQQPAPSTPLLSSDEFAQSIKAKYPQYANVDNNTLTQKMLAKYPQYASKVQTAPAASQPGLVQGMVRDIASPFLRAGANIIRGGEGFAADLKNPNNNFDRMAPVNYGSYLGSYKPITPIFDPNKGVVNSPKDAVGVGLDAASTIVGGGGTAAVAKDTFKGMFKAAVKQGFKTGAATGFGTGTGKAMQQDKSATDTLIDGGIGAVAGGVGGAVLAGSGAMTSKIIRSVPTVASSAADAPATLMDKVARINPSDAGKFSKLSGGKTPGQYLDERGIYGGKDKVASQLFNRFNTSKDAVDTALEQLPGLYKNKAVETALNDVVKHAEDTSAAGATSPYLAEAQALLSKAQRDGLNQSEINAAKRLFERTVKLNYIKDGVSAGIERANNIDSSIRTWQQDMADKLGFYNIKDLNKETQLAKSLLDAMGKKANAQIGNNLVGLTDWIVASGIPHDPSSLAMLLGKKIFSSSSAQGRAARLFSRGAKLPTPSAVVGAMRKSPHMGLPAAGKSSIVSTRPPVIHAKSTKLLPEDKTGRITYPLKR
jgi:hypothetical protein